MRAQISGSTDDWELTVAAHLVQAMQTRTHGPHCGFQTGSNARNCNNRVEMCISALVD